VISGQGGWPMSVFLTPEGEPFFGGTYYPPEDRYGRIGFGRLLEEIHKVYQEQPEKIRDSANRLVQAISQLDPAAAAGAGGNDSGQLNEGLLGGAVRSLRARYDFTHGGFGNAPKFPPSMALNLLMREYHRTGEADLLRMVGHTLRKMAEGGIYDQLGGGFHRYSTDAVWLAPHFEKMLYDNALLAPTYFDAALITADPFYERIGREILDYVLKEMTDPEGGFYSTQDADSEGVEGKFYIWRPEEVVAVLGKSDGALFSEFYGISPRGNWAEGEGASILNVGVSLEDFARSKGMETQNLSQRLGKMRSSLLERRSRRIEPFKDDKILASWNGLMISAMARGTQVTGEPRYAEAAGRAVRFILDRMRTPEGVLLHSWRRGEGRVEGFLDDYATLIVGLIDLYETTFDPTLLAEAATLADRMLERFQDTEAAGFFTTDASDTRLPVRVKDFYDGATPSGNASATHGLLRLGWLLGREDYGQAAHETMRALADQMQQQPGAHHHLLGAVSMVVNPPKEVAIVAQLEAPETRTLLRALWREYLPGRVLALAPPQGANGPSLPGEIALLRGKVALDGPTTIYVCRDYVCKKPVQTAEEMLALLRQ
jgi:uncharacterized protein YyaL (SSP411 family)